MEEDLAVIVALLKRALPLKELPRTGWIIEGAARSHSDSVAAHSYSVILVSFLTARQLSKVPAFCPIQHDRVLAMATLHDLAESATGELSTGFKGVLRELKGGAFSPDEIEHEVLRRLLEDVHESKDAVKLVEELDEGKTREAKIVKFADIVDAFAHAKTVMRRTFDQYILRSEAKLRQNSSEADAGVGNHLANWLRQIREQWESVSRKRIGGKNGRTSKST